MPADASVTGIRIKHLPGHTPGSIGLIVGLEGEAQVLLSGDTILDPITPNPDDLLAYLRTLEDLENLSGIRLVLPAHGNAIVDLPARVAFLQAHHRLRLKLTHATCQEAKSVWDVATSDGYFDINADKREVNFLAASEALIHMEMLRMVDALQRTRVQEGVHYFKASHEHFDGVYTRIQSLVKARKTIPLMRY